jgi:hypothetical protein
VGGSLPSRIPEGHGTCLVKPEIGEDFVLFKKSMDHYLIAVDDNGYADFTYKWDIISPDKLNIPNNIVRDLSYRISFILQFNITFTHNDDTLSLNFDVDALGPLKKNIFNTTVNSENGKSFVYVTKFQDPVALLEKYEIDLYQLSKNKTINLPLTTNEQITVWLARASL